MSLSQDWADGWQGGRCDRLRSCGDRWKGSVHRGLSEGAVCRQVSHWKQRRKLRPLHLLHCPAPHALFHSRGWEESDQSLPAIPMSWWEEQTHPPLIFVCHRNTQSTKTMLQIVPSFSFFICCRRKLWSCGSVRAEPLRVFPCHNVLWVLPRSAWIGPFLYCQGDRSCSPDPAGCGAGACVSL